MPRVNIEETEETLALKNMTFTMKGEQFNKLNDTLDVLEKLGKINWEELPSKYLIKDIKFS